MAKRTLSTDPVNVKRRERYATDPAYKQEKLQRANGWSMNNREIKNSRQRERNIANVEEKRLWARDYYHANRETIRLREQEPERQQKKREWFNRRKSIIYAAAVRRRRASLLERLRQALRARINKALKGGYKSGSAVRDLGCSIIELKARLEALWQPGMSWENYGPKGWHIDHRRALATYDLTDPEQFRAACHYTNLQPLWATDNIRKGAK